CPSPEVSSARDLLARPVLREQEEARNRPGKAPAPQHPIATFLDRPCSHLLFPSDSPQVPLRWWERKVKSQAHIQRCARARLFSLDAPIRTLRYIYFILYPLKP